MTLYSLFHPLVVYMVSARVDAAAGNSMENGVLYSHVMRELEMIRKNGSVLPELAPGLDTACAYTAFYIDYMVHEGPFPFAGQWNDLGRNLHNELAGDEKFFDYLQGFMEDDSPLATDHLRLMHAMIASGFAGAYRRRSVELESLLRRLAARLAMPAEPEAVAGLMDAAAPELAAGHRQHPARVGLRVLLACSGLMLAAVACYLYTYHEATDRLRDMLGSTREQILEDAALHAHNSDSLVVSRYSLDGKHTPASAGEGETSAEIREMEDGPQETPEPAEPESAESGPEGE